MEPRSEERTMSDIRQIQQTMYEQRRRVAHEAIRREHEQAVSVLRLHLEMQKKAAEKWRIMHLPHVEIEL